MSEVDGMIFSYIVIAIVVVVLLDLVYLLVFKKHRKNGHYTVPGANVWFKKLWAMQKLRGSKQKIEDYVADFRHFKSENIKVAQSENHSDSQMFYGCDDQGNSLLIKLHKQKNQNDEVWLILRLENGQVFTLPDHPRTDAANVSDKFESLGLCIEPLLHYKSLRITFSGLLRETSDTTITDQLRFVKFNFIWGAATAPKHYPDDWNINLRASALAKEPWNSANWENFINTPKFGGYDQFGALHGQVFIEDINEKDDLNNVKTVLFEMNLPGFRKRRCLPSNMSRIRRYVDIIGVCLDGSVFEIGAISYHEKMTHAEFGYIRNPNTESYSIEWTDLHLLHIAEESKSIVPKRLSIQFKANKMSYSSVIHFIKKKCISLSGENPSTWFANTVPVEIGLNGQRGFGIAILYYGNPSHNSSTVVNNVPIFKLVHSKTSPKNKLVLHFNDIDASSLSISGGKGASLALLNLVKTVPNIEMEFLKFKVPFGFIVTVTSFDLQMRRNPILAESILEIKNVAYGIVPGDLELTCQKTVEKFKNLTLEKEVVATVTQHFEDLVARAKNSTNLKFAVRSSAIGEDGDDASSAGQNDTFLGLRNLDEVLESIKLCWASLFTYQSVEYRRQHIQPIDTQMAVVVQIMVPSDCAGVLFTRHANGDPSKILITANYGLGESVVSGAVDPDSYIVKRVYDSQELSIQQKIIGSKTHFLHMNSTNDGSNVMKKQLSPADQSRSCLSDEQILNLSKIGVLLEKHYGNARDIEWAIYQNEIYLLQSRPITTLNALSNWELLHEFDTPIMAKSDLSTFAVFGELFPAAISPLTLSTILAEMERRQDESLLGKHDIYNGRFGCSYTLTHCRVALNVHKMLLTMVGKEITRLDKMIAITMFGHEYITPEIHRTALHRNAFNDASNKYRLMRNTVSNAWNNKKILESNQKLMQTIYGRYSPDGLEHFQNHDASMFNFEIEFELTDIDRYAAILGTHFNTSKVSSLYQMLALILLTEESPDLTTEHYADIALMLGSCKDVESAEVPKLLEEIAVEIYSQGKAEEFININPLDGVQWLDQNCSSAVSLIQIFLKKHGHRALEEYDLIAITWGMKPDLVIGMIQATVKGIFSNKKDVKQKKKDLTNKDIIHMLKTPKKRRTRFMLSKIIPLSHNAVQLREKSKSAMIAFIHELRKAYRHLAVLLYSEGLLPNPELIFFFHRDEISELLHEPTKHETPINKSALINKALRRMKLFPTWSTYRFNEINHGVVKPINEDDDWNVDGNIKHVTGTPVSEGVITARACVIKSFSEVHKIQQGDILVTYGTDIGWSPYFPILGGVVTELGGLISHGAIVAREYGLPCIVGCTNATNIFKFGETITMNGSKGIIIKVEDKCENLTSEK